MVDSLTADELLALRALAAMPREQFVEYIAQAMKASSLMSDMGDAKAIAMARNDGDSLGWADAAELFLQTIPASKELPRLLDDLEGMRRERDAARDIALTLYTSIDYPDEFEEVFAAWRAQEKADGRRSH